MTDKKPIVISTNDEGNIEWMEIKMPSYDDLWNPKKFKREPEPEPWQERRPKRNKKRK